MNFKITGLITPQDGTLSEKRDRMIEEFLAALQTGGIQNVTASDIAMSRVIKVPGQNGLVLMIKLKEEDTRDRIYSKRTRVKIVGIPERKLYINEDLTKEDASKLSKARRELKNGSYTSVWTYYGKVYAKVSQDGTPLCLSD